jgi:hypothetical protein
MPTVLEVDGYKFKFFSNENNEPAHIHITKAEGNAKYWLEPDCKEEYSYGFTVRDRRDIREIFIRNKSQLTRKWHEYFKQ